MYDLNVSFNFGINERISVRIYFITNEKMSFENVIERINVLFNEIVKCQNQMCEYIYNFKESHSLRNRLYWTNEIKKTRALMKSLKTELSMYLF